MRIWQYLAVVCCCSWIVSCASPPRLSIDPNLSSDEKIALYQQINPVFLDPNKSSKERMDNDTDFGRSGCATALSCAIQQQDYKLAKWLTEYNVPTRGLSGHGQDWHYIIAEPLMYDLNDQQASRFLALLLDAGYKPDYCSGYVETPLKIAISKGYLESVKTLLSYHASLKQIACKHTDHLYKGKNSDARVIKNWQTPLARAILVADINDQTSLDILQLLLDKAEDPSRTAIYEIQCGVNGNLLYYAKCKNKPEIHRFLTDYYIQNDKLSAQQKAKVIADEKRSYKERAELLVKQQQAIAANRAQEAALKRQLDSMDEQDSAPLFDNNYQTVAEMLNIETNTGSSVFNTSSSAKPSSASSGLVLSQEKTSEYQQPKESNCAQRPDDCKASGSKTSAYLKQITKTLEYRYDSDAYSCASLRDKLQVMGMCSTFKQTVQSKSAGYYDKKQQKTVYPVVTQTIPMQRQALYISACQCEANGGPCKRTATWYCGRPNTGQQNQSTGKVTIE